MPTFTYVAYTEGGKSNRGRLEALDSKDAREKLLRQGLYAREVKPVTGGGAARGASAARRAMLYRELSALLTAGLTLEQALGILAEAPGIGLGSDLAAVRDRIREGGSFSDALMERLPGVGTRERAVITAGEASGNLARVAGELADTLEEESVLEEQVRSAMVYPAVVTLLAVVVMGVMTGVLIPIYERLLSSVDGDLPGLTRAVMGIARAVRHPLVLSLLVLTVGLIWWGLKHHRLHSTGRLRFRLPGIGTCAGHLARARFARTLAMMLEGGVQIPEAVRVASQATGSSWLASYGDRLSEQLMQGDRLARSLASVPILGEDLPGWVEAGEAGGDMASLLRHAARSAQRGWSRSLDRLITLLEPLLIVLVGGLILLVALSVLLPLMRMNQTLSS